MWLSRQFFFIFSLFSYFLHLIDFLIHLLRAVRRRVVRRREKRSDKWSKWRDKRRDSVGETRRGKRDKRIDSVGETRRGKRDERRDREVQSPVPVEGPNSTNGALLANVIVSERTLATVPNIHVLLNDVLFMEVVQPQQISYTYKIRPAKNFGTNFPRKYDNVMLVATEPYHGCTTPNNADLLMNNLAFVQRGECSFVTKTLHAQAAGAVGVVITDNDLNNDDQFIDMVDDNTERLVDIPAAFLLGKDGHVIKSTLERLGLSHAVVNIPLNITGSTIYQVQQPPWTLW